MEFLCRVFPRTLAGGRVVRNHAPTGCGYVLENAKTYSEFKRLQSGDISRKERKIARRASANPRMKTRPATVELCAEIEADVLERYGESLVAFSPILPLAAPMAAPVISQLVPAKRRGRPRKPDALLVELDEKASAPPAG